jgi:hypothetical protein
MRATLGPEPVAVVTEILFENRTQYLMNPLLNQPIDYGRDRPCKLHSRPIPLWDGR